MRFFLCGLSKSGKTTLSQHAAQELLGVEHIRVSRLLKNANVRLPVLTLADGMANQKIAAKELAAHRSIKHHQLIDGHALIETLEGPLLVPDWFFDKVPPDVVIYLSERPETLIRRRGGEVLPSNIAEIAALSSMELAACERVAARLKARLHCLQSPSCKQFAELLLASLHQAG